MTTTTEHFTFNKHATIQEFNHQLKAFIDNLDALDIARCATGSLQTGISYQKGSIEVLLTMRPYGEPVDSIDRQNSVLLYIYLPSISNLDEQLMELDSDDADDFIRSLTPRSEELRTKILRALSDPFHQQNIITWTEYLERLIEEEFYREDHPAN